MAKKPRIIPIQFTPGLEPSFIDDFIDNDRVDVFLFFAAPTGSVPASGKYSWIPSIKKATEKRIPIFSLRGVYHARGETKGQRYRKRGELNEPEFLAIKAGMISLELADASMADLVTEDIRKAYKKNPEYTALIKAICKKYNTLKFNIRLEKIRGKPLWDSRWHSFLRKFL